MAEAFFTRSGETTPAWPAASGPVIPTAPSANHREELDALDGTGIQEYFRFGDPVWQGGHLFYDHWFYDLRDIAANAGASDTELDLLDTALDDCIIYKAATEKFIGVSIDRYSGLSMYLPGNGSRYLDSFYRNLAWDAATGLVSLSGTGAGK